MFVLPCDSRGSRDNEEIANSFVTVGALDFISLEPASCWKGRDVLLDVWSNYGN